MSLLLVLIMFSPSLDSLSLRYLNTALDAQTLTLNDLGFYKSWAEPDSFRLKLVDSLLSDPIAFAKYHDLTADSVSKNLNHPWVIANFMLAQISPKTQVLPLKKIERPKIIEGAVEYILNEIANAQKSVYKALSRLRQGEIDTLLYEIYSIWADEDDSLDDTLDALLLKEIGREPDTIWDIKTSDLLKIMKKVAYFDIAEAGIRLLRVVENLTPIIDSLAKQMDTTFVLYSKNSKALIVGKQDDFVDADTFDLVIDLGGDDIYIGRTAGSVGIEQYWLPVKVVIDLNGNDEYIAAKGIALGTGVAGIGILIDQNGNDIYTSGPLGQGAGLLGFGLLWDKSGDDKYFSGFFGQGAGNFGIGLLIDSNGNDFYSAVDWAQGLGGPAGYGLLADKSGNDIYYAGGHYPHRPLLPDRTRSFAQGFGIGWRPDASGGIGYLIDMSGNDHYSVEVYGQGTAYWFSIGMLTDLNGNDFYTATEYAQGAGIHLALGLLRDLSGNDHYFSTFGPSQGEGHDFSVGILIDDTGNDDYTVSGGLGIGLHNSVGLFIDKKGDDSYMLRESLGLGDANISRGLFGIGVFLDLGGRDFYPLNQPAKNNNWWIQGHFGIGIDTE